MWKKWAKHLNGPETELQNGKCHEPEVYGALNTEAGGLIKSWFLWPEQ